jgi:hypothetical protein
MAEFVAGWDGLDGQRRVWFSAIARLEYSYMEIFEAADWEVVAPEKLATAELGLQPHVVLLDLQVPADLCEGWDDFQERTEVRAPIHEVPVWVAVWRGENRGRLQCRLDEIEFELLKRLQRGGKLETLFAEATVREPTPEEISNWFTNWQLRGWIAEMPSADVVDFPPVSKVRSGDVDWSGVDKMGSQAMAMED